MAVAVRYGLHENRSKSLSDRVFELLRDQIVTFELDPFHAISEKKISETIGVSRTPVREALARLADHHLVDIYPQRGTLVAPLRRLDLERSQFMREVLEVGLVQRVAARPERGELVRKLRAEVALQGTFAGIGEEARFFASDEDFHRLIATYAGLPGLWEEIERCKVHMDRCRHLSLVTVDKDYRVIVAQHNTIIDAIEAGDVAASAEAMRIHLRRILEFVEKIARLHPQYFESDRDAFSLASVMD